MKTLKITLITLFIIVNGISASQADNVIMTTIDITDDDTPVINNIDVFQGNAPRDVSLTTGYHFELLDDQGNTLYSTYYEFSYLISVDKSDPIILTPSEVEKIIVIPYIKGSFAIKVTSPSGKVDMKMLSPEQIGLPVTHTTRQAAANQFHILFMASGYISFEDQALLNRYMANFKKLFYAVSPFNEYSESQIQLHLYNPLKPLGCSNISSNSYYCDRALVFKTAAQSGYLYDEIVVIVSETSGRSNADLQMSGPSVDSFCRVDLTIFKFDETTKNSYHTIVHELGHSAFGLGDEYLYTDASAKPGNETVNCKSTSNWDGLSTETNVGCHYSTTNFHPDTSMMETDNTYKRGSGYNRVSIIKAIKPILNKYIPSGGSVTLKDLELRAEKMDSNGSFYRTVLATFSDGFIRDVTESSALSIDGIFPGKIESTSRFAYLRTGPNKSYTLSAEYIMRDTTISAKSILVNPNTLISNPLTIQKVVSEGTALRVTWAGNSSNVSAYKIYYRSPYISDFIYSGQVTSSTRAYVIPNITVTGKYIIAVAPVLGSSEGIKAVYTYDYFNPAEPSRISINFNFTVVSDTLRLSWWVSPRTTKTEFGINGATVLTYNGPLTSYDISLSSLRKSETIMYSATPTVDGRTNYGGGARLEVLYLEGSPAKASLSKVNGLWKLSSSAGSISEKSVKTWEFDYTLLRIGTLYALINKGLVILKSPNVTQ